MISSNLCLLAVVTAIVAIVAAMIIKYFTHYSALAREIKTELTKAETWDKYVELKVKLRCLRLSALPFVTPEKCQKLLSVFTSKDKKDAKRDGLVSMMLPSILGVVLCSVALASVTWAVFSTELNNTKTTFKPASFEITAELRTNDEENAVVQPDPDGSYTLLQNKSYIVTLSAVGTVKNGGYCIMRIGDDRYYSQQFIPKADNSYDQLTFTLNVPNNAKYTFLGVWGTYSSQDNVTIIDGGVFPEDSTFMLATEPETTLPTTEPTQAIAPAGTQAQNVVVNTEPAQTPPVVPTQPVIEQPETVAQQELAPQSAE